MFLKFICAEEFWRALENRINNKYKCKFSQIGDTFTDKVMNRIVIMAKLYIYSSSFSTNTPNIYMFQQELNKWKQADVELSNMKLVTFVQMWEPYRILFYWICVGTYFLMSKLAYILY